MNTRESIEEVLRKNFSPAFLRVEDDSAKHAGHAGAAHGGGHYQVMIVADVFRDKSLLDRHRLVNDALKNLFSQEIHALALKTLTPEEWRP